MPERLQTKRQCHLCGRYGTRGFRWVPETTEPWGKTKVGGWWKCEAYKACLERAERLRVNAHSQRADE